MYFTWQQQFTLLLTKYYVPAEAARASSVLLPAILGDFRKMLSAAPIGKELEEFYNTEDGKTSITVRGKKMKIGKKSALLVTDLLVADFPVQFDLNLGFGRCLILEITEFPQPLI